MAQHARLFNTAGYPTTIVAGRGAPSALRDIAEIVIVPEISSDYAENRLIADTLDGNTASPAFLMLQDRIEKALSRILAPRDIVIAHNVMTAHFNLPLTAAIHRLVDKGCIRQPVVWCHDLSRHVNPASGATLRFGFPWDMLRTKRKEFTYVAVSTRRQHALAEVLNCPSGQIRVIPNGVDPAILMGLSDLGQRLVEEHRLLSADIVILMPVRITRAKNIEFALQVTAFLKAAGAQVRLVITGPPDPHAPRAQAYFAELKALRDVLQLRPEAIFIYDGISQHPVPLLLQPSTIGELYRVADLVLMPSHREGFGMPILEAALTDKPIFTTPLPVLDDLTEDGLVHLIQGEETPQAVASRIQEWAIQDVAHRLRRLARRNYTWSTIFEALIGPLIENLAQSPRDTAR